MQILRQQLRMFANQIDVGTPVIRIKDCRIRNETSNVRVGSKADIALGPRHAHFIRKSGHRLMFRRLLLLGFHASPAR